MEEHVRELREELTAKQHEVNQLQERIQSMDDDEEEGMQRKQLERKLQEMREDYFELKRQLNSTLISYNQSTALEQTLPFGQRPFPPDRLNEIQTKLAVPLTRDEVATRSGGGKQELVYVETHRVMEKLFEIFQFSCSIEVKSEPQVIFKVDQGRNSLVMKCIVRVTLQNGCFHEDVGVHISHMSDTAESVKLSTKSCVSDGIKRALQHFGPALGSCLRDKDYTNDHLASQQAQKQQYNGNQMKGGSRLPPPQPNNGASNTYNDHKKMKITPPSQQQQPAAPMQYQRPLPQPPPPQQQQQPRVPPPFTPITPRQPINGWAEDHSSMPSLSASSAVTSSDLTPPPPVAATASGPGASISSSATDDDDYKTWAMMEEAMKATGK